MPEGLAVVLIVAAAVVGMLLLLFCVLPWLIEVGSQLTELENSAELPQRRGPHAAPRRPYLVDEAHWVTQEHIDCDARTCGAKGAAIDVLIEAGRMRPGRNLR
ncbi:hypothetical protein IU459_20160 [Nocardia amamiensis]|uniref:Uncharacterized protein n=1 Tax=Nocardia amamiensis TaxID=404578 RepID=A0ABS0CT92_9NOCA|nr:hypothetical protein [Nocardia amamiensis]MBF6299839.1 hypothetical protein [Nocardia amamiensis]